MTMLAIITWESIRAIPRIVPFSWGFVAAPVLYVTSATAQPFTPPAQFVSTTSEVLAVSRENAGIRGTNVVTEVINGPPPVPIDIPFVTSSNAATFALHYLAFDPVPGATGYRIYVTPVAAGRAIEVSTNFVTPYATNAISNMLYGTTYWIQAQTLAPGTQSDLSMPFQWPQPRITYYPLTVQSSSDLTHWVQVPSAGVVVTSPPDVQLSWRIAATTSNNVDPYQIRQP